MKRTLQELTQRLVDSEKNNSAQHALVTESTRSLDAKERALHASESALKQHENSKIELVNLQEQVKSCFPFPDQVYAAVTLCVSLHDASPIL